MPIIALPVDESYNSNLRPVVDDVVKSILTFTGLPVDTPIQYPGLIGTVANPGSTIDEYQVNNRFVGATQWQLEVVETPKEERILSTAVNQVDALAIVCDPKLGVYMRPIYTVTDVTITVRCQLRSHTAALMWLNQFKYKASQGRVESLHEVNYHYPIPLEILAILNHIGELKESQGGYGETLKEWYARIMTPKRRVIANLAGSGKRVVIGERQVGLLGAFDFMVQPQSLDRNGETGGYTVGFDYTFTYDKVTGISFQYPLMVHNQHIDTAYCDLEGAYQLSSHCRYPTINRNLLDYHAAKRTLPHQMLDGIPIPGHDDWIPKAVRPRTQSLLRVMLAFTPDDLRSLFSLRSLGDYELTPTADAFIQSEGNNIMSFGESVFYATLYRGTLAQADGQMEMDSNLNIFLTYDADIRQTYHFRLALISDFNLLSKAAQTRLRNNPTALIEIIRTINPEINIDITGRITDALWQKIMDALKTNGRGYDTGVEHRLLTVGNYLIVAHGA